MSNHMNKGKHLTFNEDMDIQFSTRMNAAIDRIQSIPKGFGRISAVAQLLGEQHQTVRIWISDGKKIKVGMPDMHKVEGIAKILQVDLTWLMSGDPDNIVFADSTSPVAHSAEVESHHLGAVGRFVLEHLNPIEFSGYTEQTQNEIIKEVYNSCLLSDGDIPARNTRLVKENIKVKAQV